MPLRAITNNQDFYAFLLTEQNRTQEYNCPFCKQKFTPVIPQSQRIKHFRHQTGTDHFNEPETITHLQMKQKIYDTATALGWTAKLEIQIGEHITDVVLEQKKQTSIAVECQCSH